MLDTFRRLLLAASLLLLAGCGDNKPSPAPLPDNSMVPLQVSILNYTDDYIGVVYVNGSWASNMVAHSGGGKFAGSAEVPREWDPNYTLTIHWQTGELFDRDPDALYKREVATEPYQQYRPGGITMLWVAFFPDDVIKLFPTRVDPSHPDFPEGLLAPSWQCQKEFPGDAKCFRRTPSWEMEEQQPKEESTQP